MKKGKWVVFTEDGVNAPFGEVWSESKAKALGLCCFSDSKSYIVKHESLLTKDDMQLLMSFQLQPVSQLYN
jgi:hypothetical protein